MGDKSKIIFFGTTNELSKSALASLLVANVSVKAVVVSARAVGSQTLTPLEELQPAASHTELPLVNRYHDPSLIHQAWSAGIPVLAMNNNGYPLLRALMKDMQLDVACVACFPRRIPRSLMTIPRLGFLNIHPSLLPFHRGPAPLFWLFQMDDIENRGVTVHQIDEGLDTGPVVRREPIDFASGTRQTMIESQCGHLGGRLLLEAIESLSRDVPVRPQSGTGSYDPWPTADDFSLDIRWSALRAFNFMRATDGSSTDYRVSLPDKELSLREAVRADPDGKVHGLVSFDGTYVQIQFNPGVLTAKISQF